ncbi:MAG: leucine-rich repeat domain-containing protein [Bacteroidales bacterium]|jgi:hypothetical protein|nr:leucine-rich repeat domain-containing protein [Bacteroidales bacterium]
MKKLFLFLTQISIFCATNKTIAQDFSANNNEGIKIYYDIISSTSPLTVKVIYHTYSGSIVIPSAVTYNNNIYSVTTIGNKAFYNCNSLTAINIPHSVTTIENGAFVYCNNLTRIDVDTNNPNYSSVDGVLFNKQKNTLIQYPSGKTGSYSIPYSVAVIENYAFFSCTGLTDIIIPNSVTAIGEVAFASCSGLTSVTVPNSVTMITDWAFSACSSLTSVTIPNSVIGIGNHAFSSCRSLTAIDIPNSVTTIGHAAFYNCSGLKNITIPNSVTVIENNVFGNCNGLISITIPNSVTTIGKQAFYNCSALTATLTIPYSVTTIGDHAFSGCSSLTAISVDENNTVYASDDGVLFDKKQTVLIRYPAGKTGSYTVPNSVTTIKDYAFSACRGLTAVIIPYAIMAIGDYAFSNCKRLTAITINAAVPPRTENNTFYKMSKNIPIYVPCNALVNYRKSDWWSDYFNNIIENCGDDVGGKIAVNILTYSGKLLIECRDPISDYTVKIINASDKEIMKLEATNSKTIIDVSAFAKGEYKVSVIYNEKIIASKYIVR